MHIQEASRPLPAENRAVDPGRVYAWIARQPVVDADQNLVAYEILYRSRDYGEAEVTDGSRATSEVLLSVLADFGLEKVVGDLPALVNVTREYLVGTLPLPDFPQRLVLEVLEDIPPDSQVICGLRQLRQSGYVIALDDFVYDPGLEPLLELASVVKVDLQRIEPDALPEQIAILRRWPVQLLAEKVEDREQFALCRSLGFQWYQGHFLSHPEVLQGRKLDASRLSLMKVLACVHDPVAEFSQLETAIEEVPALCIKLLRYVNSSRSALRYKVESLHRALVLLGVDEIRTVATLLALTHACDAPTAVVDAALLRAFMCRRFALAHSGDPHTHFTVGLLSHLDVLMGQPLDELISSLPLDDKISSAILHHDGPIGRSLKNVIHYERGEWDELVGDEQELAFLAKAYLEALIEARACQV